MIDWNTIPNDVEFLDSAILSVFEQVQVLSLVPLDNKHRYITSDVIMQGSVFSIRTNDLVAHMQLDLDISYAEFQRHCVRVSAKTNRSRICLRFGYPYEVFITGTLIFYSGGLVDSSKSKDFPHLKIQPGIPRSWKLTIGVSDNSFWTLCRTCAAAFLLTTGISLPVIAEIAERQCDAHKDAI